jgi:hypothetical protein
MNTEILKIKCNNMLSNNPKFKNIKFNKKFINLFHNFDITYFIVYSQGNQNSFLINRNSKFSDMSLK